MYKVVLVDDETVILQGLKKLIDWKQLNLEIVGEAFNGQSGLECIQKYQPDIVITDISMDKMSGIEMLREIRLRELNTKVILLSGYQEFSYARDAIRYDAVEYLLKPVSPEELSNLLKTVIQKIKSERSVQVLQRNDSKAEVAFKDSLQQKNAQIYLGNFKEKMKVREDIPGAVCVSARIFYKGKENSDENINLIRYEIYEYIQQWLEEKELGAIIRKELSMCSFLLCIENDRTLLRELCKEISNLIKNNFFAELLIGVGAWGDQNANLTFLYKTSKFAAELYYFEERKYIDYDDIAKEYVNSIEDYQEKIKEVCRHIVLRSDSDVIVDGIRQCVELLGSIYYGNKITVTNSCILMAGEIYGTLQECGFVDPMTEQGENDFLEQIRRKVTLQSLKSLITDYYSQVFLRMKLLGVHRESTDILKIRQYLQEHFRENITLESVANYIGMNASYLSVFFKKETGESFKGYLTNVRMKEAMKLLNASNMKGSELAEAVGYRDIKQFRKNFRETYGVSPQDYKKRGIF